jgi:hypothetical protein
VDAPLTESAVAALEDVSAPATESDPEEAAEAATEVDAGAEEQDAEEPRPLLGIVTPPGGYQAASMHDTPSTSAPMLGLVPGGEAVQLLGSNATGDGYPWVLVRTADGGEGWVIAWAITVSDTR